MFLLYRDNDAEESDKDEYGDEFHSWFSCSGVAIAVLRKDKSLCPGGPLFIRYHFFIIDQLCRLCCQSQVVRLGLVECPRGSAQFDRGIFVDTSAARFLRVAYVPISADEMQHYVLSCIANL